MKVLIKEKEDKKMFHHTGTTNFSGCQCYKDCSCKNDFKPSEYNYYTVVRRIGTKKQKTTTHANINQANERWEYICSLTF